MGEELGVGSVVKLKTNTGPRMVVSAVDDGEASVYWVEDDAQGHFTFYQTTFEPEVLMVVQ